MLSLDPLLRTNILVCSIRLEACWREARRGPLESAGEATRSPPLGAGANGLLRLPAAAFHEVNSGTLPTGC